MKAGIVLVLRCGLAVAVTTAAVQLWGLALQDDVPLPAPILALPATDVAVAASHRARSTRPAEAAVVVSAQLIARAQPTRPQVRPDRRRSRPARPGAPLTPASQPPAALVPRPPPPPPPAPVAPTTPPEAVPLAPASPADPSPDVHASGRDSHASPGIQPVPSPSPPSPPVTDLRSDDPHGTHG
jgi:hypothetical protein